MRKENLHGPRYVRQHNQTPSHIIRRFQKRKNRRADPLLAEASQSARLDGRAYREKGGTKDFNCTNLQLTSDDIDALERAITSGTLPETCGFFFGASDGSEREDDLEFIAKARSALAKGFCVYYHSWW